MKPRRYPHQAQRAHNVFAKLPPSQAIIARAARAGVDTKNGAAIKAWRAAGEPATWR